MELPYPPSVNKYWIYTKHGKIALTKKVREYKKAVAWTINLSELFKLSRCNKTIDIPVVAMIELYPPDNRVRDTDNTQKAIFDALQYAYVIQNDQLIVEHHVKMFPKKDGEKSNYIFVEIWDAKYSVWDKIFLN